MSVDLFVGVLGVLVPLINTSLICWLIWFSNSTAHRNEEIAEQLRQRNRQEREESLKEESDDRKQHPADKGHSRRR